MTSGKTPRKQTGARPPSASEQMLAGTLLRRKRPFYSEGLAPPPELPKLAKDATAEAKKQRADELKRLRKAWRENIELIKRRNEEAAAHPDGPARTRIEAALQEVNLDLVVCRSATMGAFVSIMRELLHEHRAGETLAQLFEPLHTLLAQHGGGRPSSEATWSEWNRRVEELRRQKRQLSAQEVYEDVAALWNDENPRRKPVKWTAVRDGISKLKKLDR